jgi:hypothetical protein
MKRCISASRAEDQPSRQPHCDLPEGTYERGTSKEGLPGPAAFFGHRGDRVRIEMLDAAGHSIFGGIDQKVVRATAPG